MTSSPAAGAHHGAGGRRPVTLGVTLPLPEVELHQQRSHVERLVSLGFTDLWTGEVDGLDGVAQLGLYRGWCPAASISVGVLNVYTRTPPVLAMTAAALGEMAPGHCRLGLGTGSDIIVEGWNGIPFVEPYRRLANTLIDLRRLLHPDDGSDGRFRLSRVPRARPRLVIAALGPRVQRLAMEQADGVVLNFLSPADVATVVDRTRAHVRLVDEPLERIVRIFIAPGTDGVAEQTARRHLAGYLTVDAYARFQRWLGRDGALQAMAQAWNAGDRKAALRAIPQAVVDDLVLDGDPARCARAIERYADHGADVLTLTVLPLHGRRTDPEQAVDLLADISRALATGPRAAAPRDTADRAETSRATAPTPETP